MLPIAAARVGAIIVALTSGAATTLARTVPVQDTGELVAAIEHAGRGDDIVLADGVYVISAKIHAAASGSPTAPITVHAAHRQGAHIRSAAQIAFEVTGANWHFFGLDIVGACLRDTDCEHAFHVVGNSSGFLLKASRLADFNAHIKVNANAARQMPAEGVIDGNEFLDTRPRRTDNPVAPINIDNAANWIIRANLIHDFQKDGAGEGSYGAFVKGGSVAPIIERNLVLCARDRPPMGHMVGLSFGAHGMDPRLCPPHWDAARICDPEVLNGIIRNNIVANCNAEGIYLNRAAGSAILFNTLVSTAGIDFSFPSSVGRAMGNLMMGYIRATHGGQFADGGNVTGLPDAEELAAWFRAPIRKGHLLSLPGPDRQSPDDYCGRSRGSAPDVGAIQASSGTCALWR